MRCFLSRSLLLAAVVLSGVWEFGGLAAVPAVWPRPQQIEKVEDALVAVPSLKLLSPGADAEAVALLGQLIPFDPQAKLSVRISEGASHPALKPVSGAYRLAISPLGIEISAWDGRGSFYAVQTLRQLRREGKLPCITINDYPAVPFRGVVEGFYGQPWSHEARLAQFRFYGQMKLNAYIYGPKDDPFHGFSNRWREPYPEDKAAQIRELVQTAKANKVNFVWAVHPGQDIHWQDDRDALACIHKFELMYALGVRSFAVFFDDISGEGARAEKQAELLNRLQRDFVVPKGDVTPLILCPTQYNKAWSGGDYLDILGKNLDPSIMVMWTGDSVVHDLSADSMQWINNRLKRPAFIWWNFPACDFVRNHLLLGKVYGNEAAAAPLMAGFTSNPMDKPEASKIALFGVADYCWNPEAYDPNANWLAAIQTLYPGCAAAMQTFANHNSDHGPNYHGYRREESVAIAPMVQAFLDAYQRDGSVDAEAAAALEAEFGRIATAPKAIRTDAAAAPLVAEIAPWLDAFAALGSAGVNSLALARERAAEAPRSKQQALFLKAAQALETLKTLDRTANQNPYQPGIKTGSLLLTPFVETLFREESQRLYARLAGLAEPLKPGAGSGSFWILTNHPLLASYPVNRNGKVIGLSPKNEPVMLPPGGFVGLGMSEGFAANYLHLQLENPKANEFGRLEVSSDGKAWRSLDLKGGGEFKTGLDPKQNIRFARFTNASKQPQEIKIRLFKFDVPADAEANSLAQTADADLSTAFRTELKPGESLRLRNPLGRHSADSVTLVMLPAEVQVLACDADNKWQAIAIGEDLRIKLDAVKQPLKGIALKAPANRPPQRLTLYEAIWRPAK